MPEVKGPMDSVGADLMYLYQPYSGKCYVVSVVDHLSRYVQRVALPDKLAEPMLLFTNRS